ncbi:T9SS type A sorting domain-containing protein [Chryseobacterium ginsengisoli]
MKNKINLLITSVLLIFSNVFYCNSINHKFSGQNFKMFFSCGSEDFENIPASSSSFETNSWVNNNITWTASDSRTDQTINNKAIVIRNGNLTSSIITEGIKSLTVTTQLKFAGNPGNLILKINDIQVGMIPFNSGVVTTTLDNINIAGNIIIKLVNPNTGQRVAIDDLSWTCYSNLGISEIDKVVQLSIYPNPIKNGEYLYLNKKVNEVLIYNSEGKLIKKSNLKSNSILIDNLLKGVYYLKTENTTHKFLVN